MNGTARRCCRTWEQERNETASLIGANPDRETGDHRAWTGQISEGSKRAVPVAVGLAQQADAKLAHAYVDERLVAKGDMPSVRADAEEIRAEVGRVAEGITADGADATVEDAAVVLGGPAHAIAGIADGV